jgi:hypothetical protein
VTKWTDACSARISAPSGAMFFFPSDFSLGPADHPSFSVRH